MSKVWTAVTALVLAAVMSVPVLADTFVDTGILRLVNSSHRISKDFVPEMVQYKNTSYYLMMRRLRHWPECSPIWKRSLARHPW